MTLHSADDLQTMIDHLIKCFRRLRQHRFWSDSVTAGIYVIEVTHGAAGWHAHLHVLAMARYMPQYQLSRIWNAISGAPVVDIRKVRERSPVGYITRYVTKFEIPAALSSEAESAFRNRRIWSPFGAAHDLNCQYKPQTPECPVCHCNDWMSQRAIDRGHVVSSMADP